MSDELAEIRRDVAALNTALALHDQKVDSNVTQVLASQERMASAVEKIGDATVAIRTLAEQWEKRNGKQANAFVLGKHTILWLLGILLLASASAGAGGEMVTLLLKSLK